MPDNYDQFAESYRRFRTSSSDNDRGCHELLRAMGEDNLKRRVLDIGYGQGHFSEVISSLGAEVVGIDTSESQIEIAKANSNARVRYQAIARAEFPFAKQSFDAAVSTFCLCTEPDFGDVERTIAETSRILKPGGVFGVVPVNFADVLGEEFPTFSVPPVKNFGHGSLVEVMLHVPGCDPIVVRDYFHDDEHYQVALVRWGFTEISIRNVSVADGRKLYKVIVARKSSHA